MAKLHKNVVVAFSRVVEDGGVLRRQASQTDEALNLGGGFIYFTDRRHIPPASGRSLVEKGVVKPLADGLFEGQSQSFKAVEWAEFHDFKARYEAV